MKVLLPARPNAIPGYSAAADVQNFDRQRAELTGAPSPLLLLALFPGRADCSGRLRAVGVINRVMQHPLRLQPEPPTRYAWPTITHFVTFNCLFLAVNYIPVSRTTFAASPFCACEWVSVCKCVLHVSLTCTRVGKHTLPRCLVQRHNP